MVVVAFAAPRERIRSVYRYSGLSFGERERRVTAFLCLEDEDRSLGDGLYTRG